MPAICTLGPVGTPSRGSQVESVHLITGETRERYQTTGAMHAGRHDLSPPRSGKAWGASLTRDSSSCLGISHRDCLSESIDGV